MDDVTNLVKSLIQSILSSSFRLSELGLDLLGGLLLGLLGLRVLLRLKLGSDALLNLSNNLALLIQGETS